MRKFLSFCLLLVTGLFLAGCQNLLDYKAKAGLQVITDDIPSSVFLDGQYLNSTPLIAKDLKPGQYTIRIQPNDALLVPYETTLELKKGLLTVITWKPSDRPEMSGGVIYEMEELPDKSKSEVSITTIPEGAIVTLEGKQKDFTPVIYTDVTPGNQGFEVTLPSYETQSHTLFVQPGYRMLVSVKLAKLQPIVTTEPDTSIQPGTETATASAEPVSKDQVTSLSAELTKVEYTKVKITPTGLIEEGKEVLRVRDAASPTANEIGSIEVGKTLPYTGTTYNSWHEVEFNGAKGWVSATYSELQE